MCRHYTYSQASEVGCTPTLFSDTRIARSVTARAKWLFVKKEKASELRMELLRHWNDRLH